MQQLYYSELTAPGYRRAYLVFSPTLWSAPAVVALYDEEEVLILARLAPGPLLPPDSALAPPVLAGVARSRSALRPLVSFCAFPPPSAAPATFPPAVAPVPPFSLSVRHTRMRRSRRLSTRMRCASCSRCASSSHSRRWAANRRQPHDSKAKSESGSKGNA